MLGQAVHLFVCEKRYAGLLAMLTPAACACKRTRRVLCVPGTTKGCCFCAQRSSTCTMRTDGNTSTRTTTCLTSDTVTPGVMSMPSIHSLRCPLRCACVHMWRVCDVSGLACTVPVSSVHLCAWRFVYVACGQPYALFVVCACACGLRHWVQAVSGLVRGRMLCDLIISRFNQVLPRLAMGGIRSLRRVP